MKKIIDIKAFEVLDSRGNPTVMAEVIVEGGFVAARAHHRARQQVRAKHWSCAMVTRPVISAKAC